MVEEELDKEGDQGNLYISTVALVGEDKVRGVAKEAKEN